MNQPTAKQKQEARELIEEYKQRITQLSKGEIVPCRPWLEFRLALIISSRDTEIREVLEGLAVRRNIDHKSLCWCEERWDTAKPHLPACLAARGLWERVQGEQK